MPAASESMHATMPKRTRVLAVANWGRALANMKCSIALSCKQLCAPVTIISDEQQHSQMLHEICQAIVSDENNY